MTGRFAKEPVNTGEMVNIKIGLHIEPDEEAVIDGQLWPMIAVSPDPEKENTLHVVASNYDPSNEGAMSVVLTLEAVARAIREKLGEAAEPPKPARKGFNPRSAGSSK